MFEDWHAINNLLMAYAEHIDGGRFADAAALFAHAVYRLERADGSLSATYTGTTEVQAFFEATRVHDDGTPRTKHLVTNVLIELDGDRATSRCYATVLQQTDVLPLQPIASGRYLDRFQRTDGEWQFAERLATGFLLGDRSQHIAWHDDAPGGAGS